MKKLICIAVLAMLVSGCGVAKYAVTSNTRSRLNELQIGMTTEQVKSIMGNPYKREAYQGVEYWLYQTEMHCDPIYGLEARKTDEDLTPVAFINGKVDGWGRNYYEERKQKIQADINVKQTQ